MKIIPSLFYRDKKVFAYLFLSFLMLKINSFAQKPHKPTASEIQHQLKKLNVLGSALYIAAHPDDENTRLISYLANGENINTAYLSLTRGDGGQNLIGTEIREELGVLRTQELLSARRIDGGKQYFSRANDFGYSKNADETFTIWDKEEVLADMVWVIRQFRPDVMITRFSPLPGRTHGHHTASAMLAVEAFEAAADPERFPEQLKYVETWQSKRLVHNTSWWWYGSEEEMKNSPEFKDMSSVDVGGFNPLLGKSYTEIAALSRSQHKCQAFGSEGTRGEKIEYLLHLEGDKSNELFGNIDVSWNRVKGGKKVAEVLKNALKSFNPETPSEVVPMLVKARSLVQKIEDNHWKKVKTKEIDDLIYACLGLYFEVKADDYSVVAGDSLGLKIEIVNRSDKNVKIENIQINETETQITLNQEIPFNQKTELEEKILIPSDLQYSQPYWLVKNGTLGMFKVDNQSLIGLPENEPVLNVSFSTKVGGETINFEKPVVYKWTDDAEGEMYRPLAVTPPIFANIAEDVYVFADNSPQKIKILLKSAQDSIKGHLQLMIPRGGWSVKNGKIPFELNKKGEEKTVEIELTPSEIQSSGQILAICTVNGESYNYGLTTIQYNHIPTQTLMPQSTAKVVKLDIEKRGEKIGYIKGAGDVVPDALRQIGYIVDELQEGDINTENLKNYDAIVLGIRVFNKNERMPFYMPTVLEYVKNGGTVVAQYNTTYSLLTKEIAPYPLKISRDRVTVEQAEVRFLEPDHPVLNTPNKITEKDFENWVQERGLYFPNEWSDEFTPILSMNDPEETPKEGSLLVAKYGEGHYVYTGISFFREVPAGVTGAYRLLANLVSLK